jgi:hypothetical protein
VNPVTGFNTSGDSQRVFYKNKYKYFQGPFTDVELDDKYITDFCDYLGIGEYPPGVSPPPPIKVTIKKVRATLHAANSKRKKRRK